MISRFTDPVTGPAVTTRCPFAQPRYAGVVWRATAFAHVAQRHLCGDGLTVLLPDDLLQAVPKRQAEFLAGRLCAALALQALGLPTDVPRKGRAPVWPDGAVGSITHSDTYAAAVASPVHSVLGLDCETVIDAARARDLSGLILGDAEAVLRPPSLNFAQFVTLVFSAKEALYKALSNRVGRVLEFHEVQLIGLTSDSLMLGFDGLNYPLHWRIDSARFFTIYAERHIILDEQTV